MTKKNRQLPARPTVDLAQPQRINAEAAEDFLDLIARLIARAYVMDQARPAGDTSENSAGPARQEHAEPGQRAKVK